MSKTKDKEVEAATPEPTPEPVKVGTAQETAQPLPENSVEHAQAITNQHIQEAQAEIQRLHAELADLTDKELLLKNALQALKEERKALEESLLAKIRYLKSTYQPIMQTLLF